MTPTRLAAYETIIALIERERPEHELADLRYAKWLLARMVERDIDEGGPQVAVAAARGVMGVG